MPYLASDYVLDGTLERIASATRMHACSQAPTTFAEVATFSLVVTDVAPADFSRSDVTGLTGGRVLRVAQKPAVTPFASGTATHVALVDAVNSRLLYVAPAPSTPVQVGGVHDFVSWEIELSDPVARI